MKKEILLSGEGEKQPLYYWEGCFSVKKQLETKCNPTARTTSFVLQLLVLGQTPYNAYCLKRHILLF